MTLKPINFGAGPGKIPEEVLIEAQKEFLSYQNLEFSVTELSHRSEAYAKLNDEAQNDLRELLNIPYNYKILFLHGGGQGCFAAVPLNLIGKTGSADYLTLGIWSKIPANEAKKYGQITTIDVPEDQVISSANWQFSPNASYVYYCDNETIQGIEYPFVPDTKGIPLVTDMSSNLLTKKIDVSKFGVIIAAVQKNLGTAALAIAIIRDDLLKNSLEICPSILNFKLLADNQSILNTPPVFSVYLLGKVLKWVKQHGGVEAMEINSKNKSEHLYKTIDESNGFYQNTVPIQNRSRINVVFRIKNGDQQLETLFLQQAEERKMFQLKGHKLVGGIRVSLYNAISYKDVCTLVDFMKTFQRDNL